MQSWYEPITKPRIQAGNVSAWYIGTCTEIRPTPSPAKKRPAMNMGCSVAATCSATPRLNGIRHDNAMPYFRPAMSAR